MPILKVTSNAKLVRRKLENLKAEVPKVGSHRIYEALARAMKRLKKPGKKPKRPIPWVSLIQMQAFFASEGFGGGIPHKRRGIYQKGFRIRKVSKGYELSNLSKGAKYVGGDARGKGQSPIHRGNYPLMRDEVDREIKKLPAAVIQQLKIVAKQKGIQIK